MAEAFANFLRTRDDLGGIVSVGGNSGTALAIPGMRSLASSLPRVMVSTAATSTGLALDSARHAGLMYLVIEPQDSTQNAADKLCAVAEQALGHAAHALVGMMKSTAHPATTTNLRPGTSASPIEQRY
jgi:uncharacterized protein (UPF0261 family)